MSRTIHKLPYSLTHSKFLGQNRNLKLRGRNQIMVVEFHAVRLAQFLFYLDYSIVKDTFHFFQFLGKYIFSSFIQVKSIHMYSWHMG